MVDIASDGDDAEPETDMAKLGRKGGLIGSKARAKKMTAEQRSVLAKLAATARWNAKKEQPQS